MKRTSFAFRHIKDASSTVPTSTPAGASGGAGGAGHSDVMWFFTLDNDLIVSQLQQLVDDAKTFITNQLLDVVDPQFQAGSVFLVFEFNAPDDSSSWYVHGVVETNVVSIRCPFSTGGGNPDMPVVQGASVDVVYLQDTPVAFAHFDPTASGSTTEFLAELIAAPSLFPVLLNAQAQTVSSMVESDAGDMGASAAATGPKPVSLTAAFTLGGSFRFRYECEYPTPAGPTPMQCVKFAGSQLISRNGNIISMQIDEAWSMKWQG